jgi:osmotically inducible protein OsmC
MSTQRKAHVVWEKDLFSGNGKVSFGSGAIPETSVTWASRIEKLDGKTSPEELLAAAHASCFAMGLSNTLASQGSPPERLNVTAVATFAKVGDKWMVTRMELTVSGIVPGIDWVKFEDASRVAGISCPISNALRNNVEIKVVAQLE